MWFRVYPHCFVFLLTYIFIMSTNNDRWMIIEMYVCGWHVLIGSEFMKREPNRSSMHLLCENHEFYIIHCQLNHLSHKNHFPEVISLHIHAVPMSSTCHLVRVHKPVDKQWSDDSLMFRHSIFCSIPSTFSPIPHYHFRRLCEGVCIQLDLPEIIRKRRIAHECVLPSGNNERKLSNLKIKRGTETWI